MNLDERLFELNVERKKLDKEHNEVGQNLYNEQQRVKGFKNQITKLANDEEESKKVPTAVVKKGVPPSTLLLPQGLGFSAKMEGAQTIRVEIKSISKIRLRITDENRIDDTGEARTSSTIYIEKAREEQVNNTTAAYVAFRPAPAETGCK